MDVRWILGGSVLLQVVAAILALRLIRITGRRAAWSLIATAIVLMAVRRGLSLYGLILTDRTPPHGVAAELAALGISALILLGVAFIAPTFRAMRRTELALREAQDKLEERVRERTDELAYANKSLAQQIAEYREVEDALREADAHQRLILQTVPMVIYTAEPTGQQFVVWMSGQAQQITGFPAERFLQRDGFWAARIHPQDAARVLGIFANLEEIEATAFEYRWKCSDGEYRWFLEHPTFLRDAKGKPSEIIGTWLDINERKTAEEALIHSEQRIQAIIDNTTAVIYLKDLDGKYLLINRRYAELFGLDSQSAIGMTDYDFHPAPTADTFRENDRNVLERDEPIEFEELAPHDGGDHTYLSLKFPIYDVNGEQSGICGISTDITERKRFEVDLQAAKEEAEAANRAKSSFLANISHEIRTPITAMLGAAEQMQSAELEEETRLQRADMILRNGRHLLSLVNDLLDVSRLEAGKLEIRPADCSLLEILTDVTAIAQMSDLPTGLEFKVFFETQLPETIHTDRTRLTQAIANIVSNARKFTRRGHIHLRVSVAKGNDEPRLTIAVEDTGPGIADADRLRIFDVFTQGDLPAQRSLAGAGVGLSLSRWIAEQLGGSLELQRSSSAGSVFILRIAIGETRASTWLTRDEATQRLAEGSPLVASDFPTLRGRVLLAEDVEDTRALIEEALTSAGVTVTVAVDGVEAVERFCEDDAFDLVLLDIRMPKMDGFAAGRAIRERGYRSAMIALTASTTAAERGRILAAGFDDVWMKPMSLEHLIQRVSAFLDTASPETKSKRVKADANKGKRSLTELSEEFRHGLSDRIKAIENAAQRGDLETYRELLHQLVGSAGIHGLVEVSQEAASLVRNLDGSADKPTTGDLARLLALTGTARRSQPPGEAAENDRPIDT